MRKSLFITLVLAFAFTTDLFADTKTQLLSATEIALPGYQMNQLTKDLPARDIYFGSEKFLYIAGKTSLWQWRLDTGKLKKIPLVKRGGEELQKIGSDGLSIFVASSKVLYQYQIQSGKLFKYPYPLDSKGATLGFSGVNDNWWWVHSRALLKIDRYGKTLVPKVNNLSLASSTKVAFDSKANVLWYIKGKSVKKIDLKSPTKHEVMLQTKYKPVDLQLFEDQVFINTPHTVLRLDMNGKLRQSIPVEGARRLQLMHLRPGSHAYLFSDRLLEVYNPKSKNELRYVLPIEKKSKASMMRCAGSVAALIVNGRPVAYKLASQVKKP